MSNFTIPGSSGHSSQSGFNDQAFKEINQRLQAIEQLLEIDTRYAGLNVQWKASRLAPGSASNDQQETLTAASPAASPSVPLSILKANANNVAATLAAPASDGLWKFIYPSDVTHTASLSGTNVQGQSGNVGTFGSTAAFLVLHALGSKWCIVGSSGVTWA